MRLAVLFAVLSLLAALPGCSTDPPLDVAPDVDFGRFAGKWYEIARLPRTTQTGCYGTTAFYTQASDGTLTFVNQCNVGAADGPLSTTTMTATVPDGKVPAKLVLDFGAFSGNYWILEHGPNYEYAVVGHPSREYFWILSRTPTLDDATLGGVLDRARANQFDTSRLEFTPQPPGSEREDAGSPVGAVPSAMRTGCAVSPGAAPPSTIASALASVCLYLATRRRGRRAARPRGARGSSR